MPAPIPDRGRVMARICDLYACGFRLGQIAAVPGMPTRKTMHVWAAEDAGFAAALREARAEGRALRRQTWDPFDPAVAEAFLIQVRRGRLVSQLVKAERPDGRGRWLHREQLDRWLKARPDFAAAFAEAKRMGCEARGPRWPYDPALAERIMVRVLKGEPLPAVLRDKGMPCASVLRRWRRRDPEFDHVLRGASAIAHRVRMRNRRCLCTPELTRAIADRIRRGESLNGIGGTKGMPHRGTLYRWVARRPAFRQAVTDACADRTFALAERALAIADGAGRAGTSLAEAQGTTKAILKRLGQLRTPGSRRR